MKVIFLTVSSLLFCSAIILSCQPFTLKASDNSSTNEITIPISKDNNKKLTNDNNKNNDLDNFTKNSTDSFIILGNLSASNNKIQLNGDFWGHEENEKEAKLYPDNKIELDIVNCAGYLASATTTYKGAMREVKLIPETISSDAAKKIRLCSPELKGDIVASDVFGIAPRVENRRNIKINKVDTKKLYDSLVKDIIMRIKEGVRYFV